MVYADSAGREKFVRARLFGKHSPDPIGDVQRDSDKFRIDMMPEGPFRGELIQSRVHKSTKYPFEAGE